MKSNIYCGIDPGISGAIALLQDDKLTLEDMPTVKTDKKSTVFLPHLIEILENAVRAGPLYVALEKVHAMPGQGVTSMFSFGYNYGVVLGALTALRVQYVLVTPQRWKKLLLTDMQKDKQATIIKASQMFPDNQFATPRGRLLDGRGDATMLSLYAKHYYLTP